MTRIIIIIFKKGYYWWLVMVRLATVVGSLGVFLIDFEDNIIIRGILICLEDFIIIKEVF